MKILKILFCMFITMRKRQLSLQNIPNKSDERKNFLAFTVALHHVIEAFNNIYVLMEPHARMS